MGRIVAGHKRGQGHIVIVSSGTGRYIHPSVVYSGTKHAASAIAESLRREVGDAAANARQVGHGHQAAAGNATSAGRRSGVNVPACSVPS